MLYNKLTRRHFLVGAGNVMVALPFLSSLWPENAHAQAKPDIRFLSFNVPHGSYRFSDLYPGQLPMTPYTRYANHKFHHGPLSIAASLGSISKVYSAGLNKFIQKLNILEGLDKPGGINNHADNTFLGHFHFARGENSASDTYTRLPNVASIDQFLANHSKIYPTPPVIRSIGRGSSRRRFIDQNNPSLGTSGVQGYKSPVELWNALFGAGTPSTNGTVDPVAQAKAASSSTLVDQVIQDLRRLKNRRDISSSDIVRVDNFADEMHELQKKLQSPDVLRACIAPTEPERQVSVKDYPNPDPRPRNEDGMSNDLDRVKFWDLYTSVVAAGIKCGRTKISSIGVTGDTVSSNMTWHAWTHSEVGGGTLDKNAITKTNSWVIENILVPTLTKLDVEESAGKTYLDNSLVLFGSVNSVQHQNYNIPILTAGSAGGFFNTGMYIDYRRREVIANYSRNNESAHPLVHGVLYNQLLVSIMMSMGLTESDWNILPGVRGYSGDHIVDKNPTTGELAHAHVVGDVAKPLPIFVKS